MPEIDNLSIQISANETQAVDGLAKLAKTLERLKSAVNGAAPTKSEANRLRDFGQALNALRGAENIRISSTIATQIGRIGTAISRITTNDIQRVRDLGDALRTMNGAGNGANVDLRGTGNNGQQAANAVNTGGLNAPVQMNSNTQHELANDVENLAEGMRRANGEAENLRNTLVSMEFVDSWVQNTNAVELLEDRLTGAREHLRELLSAAPGTQNWTAIANATEQVQNLEEELRRATPQAITFRSALTSIGSNIGGTFVSAMSRGTKAILDYFSSQTIGKVDQTRKSIGQFFSSIKRIAMYRLIRTALKTITEGFSEGQKNLYHWSSAVNGTFSIKPR